jgi:hypothetical protein
MICHLRRLDICHCFYKRVTYLCIHGNPNQWARSINIWLPRSTEKRKLKLLLG